MHQVVAIRVQVVCFDLTGPQMRSFAMASSFNVPKQLTTPLQKCAVCNGSLAATSDQPLQARCIDMGGVYDLKHVVKECCRRKCRVRHHYNFYFLGQKKVNTLTFGQLKFVFVTGNTCFTARFLQYQANLQFRAAASARALCWAYSETFVKDCSSDRFRKCFLQPFFITTSSMRPSRSPNTSGW